MKTRVIAWVAVLGVAWVGYTYVRNFKNPLQEPSITSVMPAMTKCKEDCAP